MIYFVATPIGNLKDITLRALEVLKSVDVILCEDTRHSLKLLNHYEIKKTLISYHKFNETAMLEKIIAMANEGKEIAVISDAGMPVISDPGNILTKELYKQNIKFTVIPGATAFVSALVLSALDCSQFTFVGFLPEKNKDKEGLLSSLKDIKSLLIFYVAPHSFKEDVKVLHKYLGNREAVAVKEITKIYEEAIHFNLKDGIEKEAKGEFVLIVKGNEQENPLVLLPVEEHINHYINQGQSKMNALKLVAKERNVSKSSLYKFTLTEEE